MFNRKFSNSVFLWIILLPFSIVSPVIVYATEKGESVKYDSKGNRDPFLPLVGKYQISFSSLKGVQNVDDIQLEGVVIDRKKGSFAIANGVVLGEHMTKDGVKILEIKESGVRFEIHGREQFKPFNPQASMEVQTESE